MELYHFHTILWGKICFVVESGETTDLVHDNDIDLPIPDVLEEYRLKLVGAAGFEPTTTCAQGRCATRLRYAPCQNDSGYYTKNQCRWMMRWLELPRNWREMSFLDSRNGPSTRTSVIARNSSVTSVRQRDSALSSVSRTHPV